MSVMLFLLSTAGIKQSATMCQLRYLRTGYGPRSLLTYHTEFVQDQTMATTDEKWVIDKLDDSNWTTWKFQMKHLLLAKGVWEVVDGTEELAEDATAAARAEFLEEVAEGILMQCDVGNICGFGE